MKVLTPYNALRTAAFFIILCSAITAVSQTTTFKYQGRLPDSYNQPTGSYDLKFNLYTQLSGESPLNSSPITVEGVSVESGVFTVSLDFGNLFDGNDRYLEISIRPNGETGEYTGINPRQKITSTPYTIRSLTAATADIAISAQTLDGTAANVFVQTTDPRLEDPRLPLPGSGDYIQNGTGLQSGANFNISGTGTANILEATQFNISGSRILGTPGDANVFVGRDNGTNNTDGNNNSFVGFDTGYNNTIGYRNSFFGAYAGFGNTTGRNNFFGGGAAGSTNTTGSYNVFIGESSFINNSGNNQAGTSSYNTFVGALSQITPGSPLFFASAFGAYSRVTSSNTIVLGKIAGVYDGVSRPADTVQIPGSLQVVGSITANTITANNFNGSGLSNLNASNITTGTLADARLSTNVAFLSGTQTFSGVKTFSSGINVSGTASAGIFNAATQFNLGNDRILTATSANNIFAGFGAGFTNPTAGDNSFFGAQAGRQTTAGGNNSFFGTNSGYGNTTGHSNLFTGTQAGQGNTTGFNNSFVGYIAGINNTTGTFNSIFGSNANVGSNNLSYATAIGARALVTTNNTIVLGKTAGTYDGVSRPADTVQIPGNLNVTGTISGSINGAGVTNLDAANITSGTLSDNRLSSNIATLSASQTFTGINTFSNGVAGNGAGLTNLEAGNITTGTLDNARLGSVPVNKGGTGLTSAGASGNFLRSNGTTFTSTGLQASDIPDLSARYLQNTTIQQTNSNFNVSGDGVVGGNLSISGALNANGSSLTSLNASNISTGTLDNARLGLIPTANIADSAVTSAKINDTAVTMAKIADNAVTTSKIAESSITAVKIGSGQVVKSLNGLTDGVSIEAGANVTITPSGNTLTISAAGGNFIQNQTTQQAGSNFNISGSGVAANLTASDTVSGNIVSGTTQLNLNGYRFLSAPGTRNIFLGKDNGNSNSTGYDNFFAGYKSGVENTTGYYNSFFGSYTGYHNTSGSYNFFAGTNAGWLNTTGNLNAFLGVNSGYNNTTGLENTMVGANTGFYNTTGDANSFIGYGVGYLNTTGHSNSFLGTFAGYNNTIGQQNTFIGVNSGAGNISGNLNVLVGASANTTVNNLSYATAIGAGATVSTSNTIALGRSDGSDKVRIFGLGSAGSTQLCRNANNEISSCSSSLRYKTNISPFQPGLSLLERLHPISFEWKEGGMKDVGFGAEDIAVIDPRLVIYNDKGEVEGVKYDRLTTVLVNAVKEQQAQIENQQRQLKQQQLIIEGLKKLLCEKNPTAEVCLQ